MIRCVADAKGFTGGRSLTFCKRPFLALSRSVPNLGGSIITAGGLAFIGATTDQYLRAFDLKTGKVV